MNTVKKIITKELQGHNKGVSVWIGLIGLLLIQGYFLTLNLMNYSDPFSTPGNWNDGPMTVLLLDSCFLGVLFSPFITISTICLERKENTLEFLLSQPIKASSIILGKLIASTILIFAILSLPTIGIVWLGKFGVIDYGHYLSGLIGLILLSFALSGLGVFISSITENLTAAFSISFPVFLSFWFIGFLENTNTNALLQGLAELGFQKKLANFSEGIVNPENVLYFIFFGLFWFLLTKKTMELKGWK
ncbi:hypothetical protein CL659_01315 [bacterium]|nr:hypothetical protein [bacterium]|tara:strand:- start:45796 stop:46536 length:741 start_codon:yes stop_codon:yes gene_type:complete